MQKLTFKTRDAILLGLTLLFISACNNKSDTSFPPQETEFSQAGNGIPQKALDKIFQPFFTTKPTGQGTGLGLSLSYDIIKSHDGEIKVETKEGEGTEFIIQLATS
jgi:signal transduction histidine kinase